jgi:2-polyprenyl-6-methoxyphenol hydroxylase-like FAD-dependent oxidoreductase
MGLTTGLLDAEALADALDLIVNEDKSLDVLDLYSDERSEVFQFFVDPLTRNNKLRATADPDRATDDWFLRAMKNPTPEFLERYGKPFIDVWRTDIREKVLERRM